MKISYTCIMCGVNYLRHPHKFVHLDCPNTSCVLHPKRTDANKRAFEEWVERTRRHNKEERK